MRESGESDHSPHGARSRDLPTHAAMLSLISDIVDERLAGGELERRREQLNVGADPAEGLIFGDEERKGEYCSTLVDPEYDELFLESYPSSVDTLEAIGAGLDEAQEGAEEALIAIGINWQRMPRSVEFVHQLALAFHLRDKVRSARTAALYDRYPASRSPGRASTTADDSAFDCEEWLLSYLRRSSVEQRRIIALVGSGWTNSDIVDLLTAPTQTVATRTALLYQNARVMNSSRASERDALR